MLNVQQQCGDSNIDTKINTGKNTMVLDKRDSDSMDHHHDECYTLY